MPVVPETHAPPAHPAKPHKPIRPGNLAFEVFGGLLVLKMGALGSAIFRKDHHAATWLADASKIHIFSATLAAYYTAKAIRSHKISSWRNAAIALFATDAIKPLLKPRPPGAQLPRRPPQPRAPTPAPAPPPPERPPGPDLMASAAP